MNPIPLYEQNNIQTENLDEICSICLDDINSSPTHTLHECNHKFHSNCLIESLRINIGCPLCRGKTINNIHYRSEGFIFRHILSFCKSKKNTSKKLKAIVKKYEKIRNTNKEITKDLRIFKNRHKEIFKKRRELQTKKWKFYRKLISMKRDIMLIPIQPIRT